MPKVWAICVNHRGRGQYILAAFMNNVPYPVWWHRSVCPVSVETGHDGGIDSDTPRGGSPCSELADFSRRRIKWPSSSSIPSRECRSQRFVNNSNSTDSVGVGAYSTTAETAGYVDRLRFHGSGTARGFTPRNAHPGTTSSLKASSEATEAGRGMRSARRSVERASTLKFSPMTTLNHRSRSMTTRYIFSS
ncbi:MAG: hypothetical protein KatS3mg110_1114 [Pirellulaceae bacterium]|nr:MAG: hypothetical protein KatS3mg110_1114 [Pirellulaceae bacterium]